MRKGRVLMWFVMAAAIISLFAYTSVEAIGCEESNCVELEGFQICTADAFYEADTVNNVITFNYTVKRVSPQRLLSFVDILIPGNIDVGTCHRILGENVNCTNVETTFDGSPVNNVTYDLKEGTPLSKFGSGISDKRALRAIIAKRLGIGPVPFSVKFKNQLSATLPKSGYAYVQVTRPINQYDSAKYLGPAEVTAENFGQAVYEEVPIPERDAKFLIDEQNKKVYDSRYPNDPLVGQKITGMRIKFVDANGQTGYRPVKNITDKALFHIGESSCYAYCFSGYYYRICY
jgi:hypothetical protein